ASTSGVEYCEKLQAAHNRQPANTNKVERKFMVSSVGDFTPCDGVIVRLVVQRVGIATVVIDPVAAATAPVKRRRTRYGTHHAGLRVGHQHRAIELPAAGAAYRHAAAADDQHNAVKTGVSTKGQVAGHQQDAAATGIPGERHV